MAIIFKVLNSSTTYLIIFIMHISFIFVEKNFPKINSVSNQFAFQFLLYLFHFYYYLFLLFKSMEVGGSCSHFKYKWMLIPIRSVSLWLIFNRKNNKIVKLCRTSVTDFVNHRCGLFASRIRDTLPGKILIMCFV